MASSIMDDLRDWAKWVVVGATVQDTETFIRLGKMLSQREADLSERREPRPVPNPAQLRQIARIAAVYREDLGRPAADFGQLRWP